MKKSLRYIAMAVLLLVFAVSAFQLLDYYSARSQDKKAFEALSQMVAQAEEAGETRAPAPGETTPAEGADPTQETEPQVLPGLDVLYAQNADLFGWLQIEGTAIDYPVMHTPGDPECYLNRAFDGSYSDSGVPFMDGACFEGCGNYLLHGHHMRDGSMFASLVKYEKKAYWQEHPVIRFDTLYESGEYEILSVFFDQIYSQKHVGFHYYDYTDLRDPQVFAEYVAAVKDRALYDTEVEAEFGDQLITLATCAYHTDNGRFVVVAKKVK